jgi:hypothetical protein
MGNYRNGNGHDRGDRGDRHDRDHDGRFDRIEKAGYVNPVIKAAVHEAAERAIAAWNKYQADPTPANRAAAVFAEHLNSTAMMREEKTEQKPVAQA